MASKIEIEGLLEPVSEENPCGEGLDEFVFDPEYGELERLAQGREEQVMGDEVVPAEDPDWRAVQDKSLELFQRVRSLRVAVYLTKALTAREGLGGLQTGMQLIDGLLERYWDHVDPLIEEDDATERLHTLGEISSQDGLLRIIRQSELVASQAIGRFTVRDYLVATEKLTVPEGTEAPEMANINQALMDCDLDQLQQTLEALDTSRECAQRIAKVFNDNVSAADGLDLDDFVRLVRDIRPTLEEALGRRGIVAEGDSDGEPGGNGASAPPPSSAPGEINSREDVVKAIDRICEYFNRHEPSSPVPLLLQRSKRLVSQDFMSILKDLTPDGVKQAEVFWGGKKDD